MRIYSILFIAATCAALSACGKPKPTAPSFVTYDSRQLAAINAASTDNANSFSNIKDRLSSINEQPLAGTDVQIGDSVINNGAPATGIKVIVKGSAFDDGILGAPTRAMVSTTNEDGKPGEQKEFTLTQDSAGAFTADVDLRCEKAINVSLVVPAKKGGQGEVQVFVQPKDKGGASSAVFSHSYAVRSETDESQNSSE